MKVRAANGGNHTKLKCQTRKGMVIKIVLKPVCAGLAVSACLG